MPGPGTLPRSSTHAASASESHQKLACQECRRRKVRCDRNFPCRRCQASGVRCTRALRKKRDPAAVNANVQSRIAKLEGLVARLQDGSETKANNTSNVVSPQQAPSSDVSADSPVSTAYVAAPFWSTLSDEIQALKDEFEDDISDSASDPGLSPETNGFEVILCGSDAFDVKPGVVDELSPEVTIDLCEMYIAEIEPHTKRFHVPTLRNTIHGGHPYLGRDADAPCNRFLIAALCFHIACFLTDTEIETRYGRTRVSLLRQTRLLVDLALIKADVLVTEELAAVQALVTYIAALRYVDSSRRGWALTALLVRVAKALYIHQEYPSSGESLFTTETRRRLWYSISLLDSYFALDRGAEPLIRSAEELQHYATPLPRNINDSDFDENTSHDTVFDEERWSEMSYSLMTYEIPSSIQRLCSSEEPGDTSELRMEVVEKLATHMEQKYVRFCNPEEPLQRLAIEITKSVRHNMALRAIRPFHRRVSAAAPPRVDNEWVLQQAVDALHAATVVVTDPVVARWKRLRWVPWHAMAVTYASLCFSHSPGLTRQAWDAVTRAVEVYADAIADTKRGMLWKPIARLRALAEAHRRRQDGGGEVSHFPGIEPTAEATQLGVEGLTLTRETTDGAMAPFNPGPSDMPMEDTFSMGDPSTWTWEDAFDGFSDTDFINDPSLMPYVFE